MWSHRLFAILTTHIIRCAVTLHGSDTVVRSDTILSLINEITVFLRLASRIYIYMIKFSLKLHRTYADNKTVGLHHTILSVVSTWKQVIYVSLYINVHREILFEWRCTLLVSQPWTRSVDTRQWSINSFPPVRMKPTWHSRCMETDRADFHPPTHSTYFAGWTRTIRGRASYSDWLCSPPTTGALIR